MCPRLRRRAPLPEAPALNFKSPARCWRSVARAGGRCALGVCLLRPLWPRTHATPWTGRRAFFSGLRLSSSCAWLRVKLGRTGGTHCSHRSACTTLQGSETCTQWVVVYIYCRVTTKHGGGAHPIITGCRPQRVAVGGSHTHCRNRAPPAARQHCICACHGQQDAAKGPGIWPGMWAHSAHARPARPCPTQPTKGNTQRNSGTGEPRSSRGPHNARGVGSCHVPGPAHQLQPRVPWGWLQRSLAGCF